MGPAEHDALVADAREQLERLRSLRRRLLPDADDPYVLSELVWVDGQIAQALAGLGIQTERRAAA